MAHSRGTSLVAAHALLFSLQAQTEHQAMAQAGFMLQPRAVVRVRADGRTSLRFTWIRRGAGAVLVTRGTFPVTA
jgi:hypothetical protein